jgi:hypothetical protein
MVLSSLHAQPSTISSPISPPVLRIQFRPSAPRIRPRKILPLSFVSLCPPTHTLSARPNDRKPTDICGSSLGRCFQACARGGRGGRAAVVQIGGMRGRGMMGRQNACPTTTNRRLWRHTADGDLRFEACVAFLSLLLPMRETHTLADVKLEK